MKIVSDEQGTFGIAAVIHEDPETGAKTIGLDFTIELGEAILGEILDKYWKPGQPVETPIQFLGSVLYRMKKGPDADSQIDIDINELILN